MRTFGIERAVSRGRRETSILGGHRERRRRGFLAPAPPLGKTAPDAKNPGMHAHSRDFPGFVIPVSAAGAASHYFMPYLALASFWQVSLAAPVRASQRSLAALYSASRFSALASFL